MELKDFIKETLVHITTGVTEAEKVCHEQGAAINPLMDDRKASVALTQLGNSVSMVKFHVQLCNSSSTSDKSGIGVFLANIGVGRANEESERNGFATSIEFTIPVKLPYGKDRE